MDCTHSHHTRRRREIKHPRDWQCYHCLRTIDVGQRFVRCCTFDGGDVGVTRAHVECSKLVEDILKTDTGRYYLESCDWDGTIIRGGLVDYGREMLTYLQEGELAKRLDALLKEAGK